MVLTFLRSAPCTINLLLILIYVVTYAHSTECIALLQSVTLSPVDRLLDSANDARTFANNDDNYALACVCASADAVTRHTTHGDDVARLIECMRVCVRVERVRQLSDMFCAALRKHASAITIFRVRQKTCKNTRSALGAPFACE